MPTATFQQGVSGYSGCLDTFIFDGSGGNTNFENNGSLLVKSETTGGFNRATLISFDLSSLSPAITVSNTTKLSLTCNAAGNKTASLFLFDLLRTTWVASQATWNIYKTGSFWSTPGAKNNGNDINGDWTDGIPGSLITVSVFATDVAGTVKNFAGGNLPASVQSALGGTLHLAIHQANNANANASFYDSTAASTSNRPLLTVDYTDPGGQPAIGRGGLSEYVASLNPNGLGGVRIM